MSTRILLAAVQCEKGDWEANLNTHAKILARAAEASCDIAVFPEMSLSGSAEPASSAERMLALDSEPVCAAVALTAEHGVAAIFGIAERHESVSGYITQVYARDGELVGVYRKRHLGEGEEAFAPGTQTAAFRLHGRQFGIAICAESGVDYPFDEPVAAGADLIFFCAAPGLYGRRVDESGWRRGFEWWESCGLADARRHAARTGAWIAMATQAGSTVDEDFPGIAALVAPGGEVVTRLPDWHAGTLIVEVP